MLFFFQLQYFFGDLEHEAKLFFTINDFDEVQNWKS